MGRNEWECEDAFDDRLAASLRARFKMGKVKTRRLLGSRRGRGNSGECSTSVESSSRASRDMQFSAGSGGERCTWRNNRKYGTNRQRDSGDSSFENGYNDDRRGVANHNAATFQPDLEAYCNGSWWDAIVLKKNRDQYYVHYEKFSEDEDEWVPLGHLRLRSRIAVLSDCHKVLDPGVDVCLMARHPNSDDPHAVLVRTEGVCLTSQQLVSVHDWIKSAWYDAKIIDIERKPHTPRTCKCSFHVQLYDIPDALPSDFRLRKLLPTSKELMRLADISIMRAANNFSFQQVVEAALPHASNQIKRRWAIDGRLWYSSFLATANTIKCSFSLESRVAGGGGVPNFFPGHFEDGTPKAAPKLRPFDAFLKEEGLMDEPESPERRPEEDAVPMSVQSSPILIPEDDDEDDVKLDTAVSGSRMQPIILDLDNDTESVGVLDKEPPPAPAYRFLDRFSSDEREASPESLEDDVGAAPDMATSSETSETTGGDELDEVVLSELYASYNGPSNSVKPMSVTADKPISSTPEKLMSLSPEKLKSLTPDKTSPSAAKPVNPATSSDSSDLDDFAGYLERNIGVTSACKRPRLDGLAKLTSVPKSPVPGLARRTIVKPTLAKRKMVKEQARATESDKEEPVTAVPTETHDSADEDLDSFKMMGLEEFADELEGVLVTESPVVRDILARSKEGIKAGLAPQVFGPKQKRQRNDGITVGMKTVVKEVSYADLFQTMETVHPKPSTEDKSADDGACLSPSWNPLMESWGPVPQQEGRGDPSLEDIWEDMRVALESEQFAAASEVDGAGEEKRAHRTDSSKCVNLDGSKSEEDHVFVFNQEVGRLCKVCGLVGLEIENMWERDNAKRIATFKDGNDEDDGFDHDGFTLWDSDDEDNPQRNSPKGGSIFDPIPDLVKHMQKHQKEGFRFLWRNLAGVDPRGNPCFPPMEPGGCVLSHAPGTGKSFLIISFLQSYMKVNPSCRPLIVAPKIMLQPWEKEFRKWNVDIPVYNFNQSSDVGRHLFQQHEESGEVQLKGGTRLPAKRLRHYYRQALLWQWNKTPSVLVISYAMFSSLTVQASPSEDFSQIRKLLYARPNILILDEGHFARNKFAQIRRQLMAVQTPLRIMLSGTLFQNNFEELYTSLNLVRSGFVKTFARSAGLHLNVQEFEPCGDNDKDMGTLARSERAAKAVEAQARKLFIEEIGNKIDRGQRSQGSSESLAQGLEQLHKLTSPFVHHYTGGVLRNLPPLRDFAIMLQPTALQEKMVHKLAQRLVEKSMLEQECIMSLVCIHPTLFSDSTFGKTLEDLLPPQEMEQVVSNRDPVVGVKTRFVINLLKLLHQGILAGREKMLVFSQNLDPLMLLEEMLNSQFGWVKDQDFSQLDGKVQMNERQTIIERFNDPKGRVRVLLASTKACGEGITLTGASRVVFMDVLWNPAVIRQAIHRAFRLGQTKVVYVYRLIASGTFEESKYRKMVWKDWKSQAIFNSSVENPEQVEKTVQEARGPPQHCFWEISGDNSKDTLLKELLRQDAASGLPAFRRIFRHGGLFDDDYDNEPGGRGLDATDWLRGDEGAESFDLDTDDSAGYGDNDDCDILEDEDIVVRPERDKASPSAFEKLIRGL